ncbi:MAG TPA: hypothetical protein DHW64_09155 [Chitinophagaceae bacterium]|nr:hypothetical protein [Chitinophagaceae bacterium]
MQVFNKKQIIILSLLFVIVANNQLFAQGCSDAGFCTIPLRPAAASKNNIQTELAYLRGEENTSLATLSVSYSRQISKKLQWDNKIVLAYVNGNYGTVFNLGDIYSTLRYGIKTSSGKMVHLLGGVKLPFNQSNLKIRNVSLPMVYQTSLGTYDLILGAAFDAGKLDMNVAVQLPVVQQNRNSFIMEQAPLPGTFPTTNLFRRKADVLWRVGYPLKSKTAKWSFNPNLLAIYHLGEDSYENIFGKRENIKGSSGLTLNANLQIGYRLNQQQSLQLSLATPFVVRDTRPDGLTRSFVASVSYQFGW